MISSIRFLVYVCYGIIAGVNNISFTGWAFWAILACIMVVDILSVFDERDNK